MALQITSFSELDSTKVDAMFATFAQLMQERHPEVELTRGVFHDLVLYFSSVLNAAIQENIDRVLASNSLYQIVNNPALADPALVDKVLSNYNLTRDAGTAAVGELTIVFGLPTTTVIPANVTFTAGSVQFQPTTSFVAVPPGSTISNDAEREMLAVGDGTYAVTILVRATTVGSAGNVLRNTKFVPDTILNNTTTAFAASDFVYGADPLSNVDYISKLATGLAAKTIGGRQSYIAAIRGQAAFANIPHISILGCGDAEQQRDQHGLFPISGGGKIDIYCQTHSAAQTREHLLVATYVGPGGSGTLWQVHIGRDQAPGFYEVVRVSRPLDKTSVGYAVTADARFKDDSNLEFVPDLKFLHESAYTRYQSAVITFEDTDTPPTGLVPNVNKALYAVTTAGLPMVAQLQDFMSARDVRTRAADVVVKAAVPCFTTISFDIRTDSNVPKVDIAAIKAAVVAAVKEVGFSGQLHASRISAAVQPFLTGRAAVGAIDMFGRIRRPDGTTTYVRDNAILQIPNDPNRLVTGRTTAFLVSEADVVVSVIAAGFAN